MSRFSMLIPIVAIGLMIFAVISVVKGSKPASVPPPLIEPARAPFEAFVAGAGLVEASSRNANIGTPVPGLIVEVPVKVGDRVKKGDLLFRLDTRELEAEVVVREAALAAAQSQVNRWKAFPRAEELPPLEARVAEAQTLLQDAEAQLTMIERVAEGRAAGEEELTRRRYAVAAAKSRLAQSTSQLALTKAGAWASDLAVAQAQVVSAGAQLQSTRIEIERRSVRAPFDGQVLQANALPGEFASSTQGGTPLMVLGATNTLHIRIDIDEHDAWRVEPNSPGVAFVRGNKDLSTSIAFVRFEPLVIPKRSLTGDSSERVDTRVLQAIYSFDPKTLPVFVGQQMDVYIKSKPLDRAVPAAPAQ